MSLLKRYRYTHGFGVHSPFAYRFIKEVIGEKDAYYDYLRLHSAVDRLIYRVAVAMQPQSISLLGGANAKVVKMAAPRRDRQPAAWVGIDRTDMALAAPTAAVADINAAIARGAVTVWIKPDKDGLKAALAAMKEGMAFYSAGKYAIFVPFARLPRQAFPLL